jgi:hypothetical protein
MTGDTALALDFAKGHFGPWLQTQVRGLTAKDFKLFEDGRLQKISKVTAESPAISEIRDNVGKHYEKIGPGGGRWIYPDVPADGQVHGVIPLPYYVLAYTPTPAPEGSCHKISVQVRGNRSVRIFGPSGYCRVQLSPSDPLQGSKFGQRLREDLNSDQRYKITTSFSAAVFFSTQTDARVYLAMGFPPKPLDYVWGSYGKLEETVGMAGRVYTTTGSAARRFSDFACCKLDTYGYGIDDEWFLLQREPNIFNAPGGYTTQLDLGQGDYSLRVVISDDHNFGRAEVHISVPHRDAQHLALSDIALAKRFRPASPPPIDTSAETPSTYIPLVSKGVEYTPTADTTFKKGDAFLFYLQLWDPLISSDPGCKQFAPAPPSAQPISSSAETSAASSATSNVGASGSAAAPTAAPSSAAAAIPSQCLPQAQINLRIVDAKSGAVVRNLDPLKAAEFAIPGNPIIPIGSGVHIDDLPPGQYRLEAQAVQLPSTSPASLNSPPPAPPQTTPWHSASFSIQ